MTNDTMVLAKIVGEHAGRNTTLWLSTLMTLASTRAINGQQAATLIANLGQDGSPELRSFVRRVAARAMAQRRPKPKRAPSGR